MCDVDDAETDDEFDLDPDSSFDEQVAHFQAALRNRPRYNINLSNPEQLCLYCGNPTETTMHRWCSPECRKQWADENE